MGNQKQLVRIFPVHCFCDTTSHWRIGAETQVRYLSVYT